MRHVDGPLESVRYEDQEFHVHSLVRPRQAPQQQDETPPPPPQPQREEHEEQQQQDVPTKRDSDKQNPPPAPPKANTTTPTPFVFVPKLTASSISFGEEQPLSAAENNCLKSLEDIPGDNTIRNPPKGISNFSEFQKWPYQT